MNYPVWANTASGQLEAQGRGPRRMGFEGRGPEGLGAHRFLARGELFFEFLHICNHIWSSQLAMARAFFPATVCFAMDCEDHTCGIVSSKRQDPLRLGVAQNFESLGALFHDTDQIAMKLHVEVCHVYPILLAATSWISDSEIG